MSREAVEMLIDRWLNEPGFRPEMRRDPEWTVQRSGVALDEDERAALRSIDGRLSDEQRRVWASTMPQSYPR